MLDTDPDFLVARASWIFGPDRPGFVDSIIQRAQKDPNVSAIADKWSTPSYSLDQAALLEACCSTLTPMALSICATRVAATGWNMDKPPSILPMPPASRCSAAP